MRENPSTKKKKIKHFFFQPERDPTNQVREKYSTKQCNAMQVGNFEQTFNTLKKSEQNPPTLHLIPSFPSLQKDSLFNSTHPFLFTLHNTASHTPLTCLTPPLFFFWESLTCGCTDPESSSLAVHVAIFNGWWTGSFCGPSMDVVGPSWMMFPMICLGCHVYGWCINKEHNCWSERRERGANFELWWGRKFNYYNIQLFWSESCDVTEPWQSFAPNITMSVVSVWGGVGNWGGKLSEKIIITIIFTSLLNFSS